MGVVKAGRTEARPEESFARFEGRVALAPAAASGICRASAEMIAAEGGTIAAVDNNREQLEGAMEAFATAGGGPPASPGSFFPRAPGAGGPRVRGGGAVVLRGGERPPAGQASPSRRAPLPAARAAGWGKGRSAVGARDL